MLRITSITIITALALLLSSCAVDTEPVEINMQLPQRLNEDDDSHDFEMPDKWWTAFNDEKLNLLVDSALSENLTLSQMWQRVEQARYAAQIAGADLLPSVDITARASRNRSQNQQDATTYSSTYSTGLIVNYELDIWGRVAANAAAGVYQWQAGEQDYEAAKISVASQIAAAWFGYIESHLLLEIINSQIMINENTLEIITMQFKRGIAEAADVLQQRQLLESNRGRRSQVLSRMDVFRTLLSVLSGKAPGTLDIPRASSLPRLSPVNGTGSTESLLLRRPDIQSAYLRVKAYDERVAARMADKMPRVSLEASVATSADQLRNMFERWQSQIAAQLLLPVFDNGLRDAQIEQQKALRLEAVYAYIETVYNAVKEVRDAASRERNQSVYVESLEKQLKLSKQAVTRISESYAKGGTDFLRLLSVQLSDRNLEIDLVSARRELAGYRIDLYKALAGSINNEG
jgi:NodT family efflux transporter outer membrane factor (OMF) lipoprotein